jgi:hypothetical protein
MEHCRSSNRNKHVFTGKSSLSTIISLHLYIGTYIAVKKSREKPEPFFRLSLRKCALIEDQECIVNTYSRLPKSGLGFEV